MWQPEVKYNNLPFTVWQPSGSLSLSQAPTAAHGTPKAAVHSTPQIPTVNPASPASPVRGHATEYARQPSANHQHASPTAPQAPALLQQQPAGPSAGGSVWGATAKPAASTFAPPPLESENSSANDGGVQVDLESLLLDLNVGMKDSPIKVCASPTVLQLPAQQGVGCTQEEQQGGRAGLCTEHCNRCLTAL